MERRTDYPKIALGAWSWGAGAAGGDQVFGNHLFEEELKPVFEKAEFKGYVFCGGVNDAGDISGNNKLQAAYDLGYAV